MIIFLFMHPMRYTAYLLLAACNSEELQSSFEHKIAICVFFAIFAALVNLD
jgi:hypothetical protein